MRYFLFVIIFIMLVVVGYIAIKLPDVSMPDKFEQPDVISYGIPTETLDQALTNKCVLKWVREISPPFLGGVKIKQQQIDCMGFPFFGKRRFAEFVIADNSLEAVWILTKKEDEALLRAAMTKEYGSPDKVGKDIEIYSSAGVALRKDKPEVAFFSKNTLPYVEALLKNGE